MPATSLKINLVEEYNITDARHQQINLLLQKCFEHYPTDRDYYKQLPSFRYLAWIENSLVGHLACEFRNIKIGESLARIFGVADLCVDQDFQSMNIASGILEKLEQKALKSKIDFIILIAQNHEVYLKNGFNVSDNVCRWLMINSHQTLGVGHRRLDNCLMYKSISGKKWNDGLVDFMGHIF